MSVHPLLRAAVCGIAALALLVIACGGDDGSADQPDGGSTPASQATKSSGGDQGGAFNACAILTKEEVAAALGEAGDAGDKTGPHPLTGQALCTYGAASGTSLGILQVEVVRTKDMGETLKKRGGAKQLYADSKLGTKLEPVSGVGDEAYRHDNSLQVLKGDLIVGIDLSIGGGGTEKKPTETKVLVDLANKVLQRVK